MTVIKHRRLSNNFAVGVSQDYKTPSVFGASRQLAMQDDWIASWGEDNRHFDSLGDDQLQELYDTASEREKRTIDKAAGKQSPLDYIRGNKETFVKTGTFQQSMQAEKQKQAEQAKQWLAHSLDEDEDATIGNFAAMAAGTLSTPTELALITAGFALGGTTVVPRLLGAAKWYRNIATVQAATIAGRTVPAGTATSAKLSSYLTVGAANALTEASVIGAAEYGHARHRYNSMLARGMTEEEAAEEALGGWILPLTAVFGVSRFGLSAWMDSRLYKALGATTGQSLVSAREITSVVNKFVANSPNKISAMAKVLAFAHEKPFVLNTKAFEEKYANELALVNKPELDNLSTVGNKEVHDAQLSLRNEDNFNAYVDYLVEEQNAIAKQQGSDIVLKREDVLAEVKARLQVQKIEDGKVIFDETNLQKTVAGKATLFEITNPLVKMADPSQFKELSKFFSNASDQLIGAANPRTEIVGARVTIADDVSKNFSGEFSELVNSVKALDENTLRKTIIVKTALNPSIKPETEKYFPEINNLVDVKEADRPLFEQFAESIVEENNFDYWNKFENKQAAVDAIKSLEQSGITSDIEKLNLTRILLDNARINQETIETIGNLLKLPQETIDQLPPVVRKLISDVKTNSPTAAIIKVPNDVLQEAAPEMAAAKMLGISDLIENGKWAESAKVGNITKNGVEVVLGSNATGKKHIVKTPEGVMVTRMTGIFAGKYSVVAPGVRNTNITSEEAANLLLETVYGSALPVAKDVEGIVINGKAYSVPAGGLDLDNPLTGVRINIRKNENGTYNVIEGRVRVDNLSAQQLSSALRKRLPSAVEEKAIDNFNICRVS